jgi:chromosome segregation ATPase
MPDYSHYHSVVGQLQQDLENATDYIKILEQQRQYHNEATKKLNDDLREQLDDEKREVKAYRNMLEMRERTIRDLRQELAKRPVSFEAALKLLVKAAVDEAVDERGLQF